MNIVYVIARSASGRATLQHELEHGSAEETICGRSMTGWSRHFSDTRIDVVFRLACGRSPRSRRIGRNHAA